MSDTMRDDAPLTTSNRDGADEELRSSITNARGSEAIGQAVTINRPADELYAFFRDFSNLPRVMENIDRIDVIDDRRSHWVVKAPMGGRVEWDAVVTDEEPNRSFAWMSTPGAEVPNSGRVEFREAGARGTVVTATILYEPPAGAIGKVIAKLFQREPAIQARRDLRRFKQLMETGEVATAAMNMKQYEKEQG